jgi:hypothetical protein
MRGLSRAALVFGVVLSLPLSLALMGAVPSALALADPRVRAALGTQGVEPSQTQDVRAFLARERAKFGGVVREFAIAMD